MIINSYFSEYGSEKEVLIMSKKGAMELSVTAIVVLILAIVMLGLGLGFIRGMFGKVSSQLEQQIAAEPEPVVPSGSSPITLSRESMITHAGDKEVMKVSIFNPTEATLTGVVPLVSCTGLTITSQANSRDIEQGKFVTFNVLVPIPSSGPDTYLCKVTTTAAAGNFYKDFSLKIIQ